MLYTNGNVPLTVVSVVLGTGYDTKGRYWEHRLTPATAARWAYAVQYALTKWGKRMRIRAGANGYRDLAWQKIARADACAAGNCNGASAVGYSSHGGNWQGRDCLAIDVDPGGLTWAQVWEACRAAGFSCGLITQAISGIPGGEPWHVIDFNAFGAIPAGMSASPVQEDDMTPEQDRALAYVFNTTQRIIQILEAVDIRTGNTETGNLAIAAERIAKLPEPADFWSHLLTHPLTGSPVPAGDFLRYEPAEHENTRRAVASIGKAVVPDFDYDKVAAEIAEKFPQLDPHAFAVAAADEADKRERERLG